MYLKRFNQGDAVSYTGRKYAKELHGKRGMVVCRVQGSDVGVVVEFGSDDSYLMDEVRHLAPFRGKTEEEVAATKEPEVQKRRGRRVVTQVIPEAGEG
jgi:hypothetical protein